MATAMPDKMQKSLAKDHRWAATGGSGFGCESVRIFHNLTSCQRQDFIGVWGMASPVLSFIPSGTDIERYRRLRRLAAELNQKIIETVPKQAMHEVGRAIGILQRGTLVFETEDETSVLMDCCLYDWIEGGKN